MSKDIKTHNEQQRVMLGVSLIILLKNGQIMTYELIINLEAKLTIGNSCIV